MEERRSVDSKSKFGAPLVPRRGQVRVVVTEDNKHDMRRLIAVAMELALVILYVCCISLCMCVCMFVCLFVILYWSHVIYVVVLVIALLLIYRHVIVACMYSFTMYLPHSLIGLSLQHEHKPEHVSSRSLSNKLYI